MRARFPRNAPPPACIPDPVTGRCAACADEAVEGRVLRVGEDALAEVEMEGQVRTVAIELIEDVHPGDVLLVHAGVAIGRVANGTGNPRP